MKLNLPSPLEKIHLNNKVGAIYIKRDDLIHPLISGNKWRKLKGIVERFNGEQIITYGGAFSNHLLAVANYAHLKGLTSKGYIRGKELNSDNPTLSECIKFGMKLVFMDREEYRELTSTLQFNTLDFNKEQLIIPEGGTTPFVKIGMKDLVDEIKIQLNSINPLHVFCSYGTGGTSLGIGMNLKKEDHLTIVPAIKGLDEIAIEKKQQELKCSFSNYSLKYYEGMKNYAAKDLELFQFCEDFLTTHNLLLDPIYTAKLMYYICKHYNNSLNDQEIVFIHTGGIQAWKGYFYRFPELKTRFKNIYEKIHLAR